MSSILGYLSGAYGTFVQSVEAYPLVLLRFLVPVLIIFVVTLAVQRVSKKAVVDSAPKLEQKREQFVIPMDFFNSELEKIKNDDYEYYLRPISSEFDRIKDVSERFKRLRKLYSKYDIMSHSSYKKRRVRGIERRRETFSEILDLYTQVRKMKLTIVEIEQEKKGENRI